MDEQINSKEFDETLQDDPPWIEEEDLNQKGKDYEFELFLSTDGKHTVHVKSNRENKNLALRVATETYDYILTRYGTKQGQAVKEYGSPKAEGVTNEVNQDTCKHVNVKFAQSKTEKNPGRWFQSCKDCGKFLGWKS